MCGDVYFISGLGSDERVFSKMDIGGFRKKNIKWIPPFESEDVVDYSSRLISQIKTDGPIILVGLSFGGIIAIELGKLLKNCTVILISSVSSVNYLPYYIKNEFLNKQIRKLPMSSIRKFSRLFYPIFGLKTKLSIQIIEEMVDDLDYNFVKWGIEVIGKWEGGLGSNLIHEIHGDNDRILPKKSAKAIIIKGGGHLMVLEKSQLVSLHLNRILNTKI